MGDTLQNANNQDQVIEIDLGAFVNNLKNSKKVLADEAVVKQLLEHEAISPHVDKRVTQGIKTHDANKAKEWEKVKDDYAEQIIAKRFPAETESDKKNRELSKKLEEQTEINRLQKFETKATAYLIAKGHEDMVFLAPVLAKASRDEDEIMQKIDDFDVSVKAKEKKAAEKILATTVHKTQSGDSEAVYRFNRNEEWKAYAKNHPAEAQSQKFLDEYARWCNTNKT